MHKNARFLVEDSKNLIRLFKRFVAKLRIISVILIVFMGIILSVRSSILLFPSF